MDNNLGSAFATKATSDGYYNGTNWGKGFIKLTDTHGCDVVLNDGRIELNKNLITHDIRRCLVYTNNTIGGGRTRVQLNNVLGFFQRSDSGVVVFAKAGKTDVKLEKASITASIAMFESYGTSLIVQEYATDLNYKSIAQQSQGVTMQDQQFESRSSMPAGTVLNRYKKGSIIYNSSPTAGGTLGWVCTSPAIGYSNPANEILTTDAVVTASSADVTIVTAADYDDIGVYTAVTLVGAGGAGADLDTYITAVDVDAGTITVNDTPSTSVNPATIKIQVSVFTPFGVIGDNEFKTLADEATPSVLGGKNFVTGGTTTITDFDDGEEGQVIKIVAEHTLDITDGTNIFCPTGGNLTMNATDVLVLIQKADGKWYTESYSDNT
jgi:hypothetical protein